MKFKQKNGRTEYTKWIKIIIPTAAAFIIGCSSGKDSRIMSESNDPLNTDLTSLTLSEGVLSPLFDPAVRDYTVELGVNISTITFTPISVDVNATVKVNNTAVLTGDTSDVIDIAVGENIVDIEVTAEDGYTKSKYIIVVTRVNCSLSALNISKGNINPEFSSDTHVYNALAYCDTASITVTPTAAENNTLVTVNGVQVMSGSTSQAVNLSAGINTITITVTTDNGAAADYTIAVNKIAFDLYASGKTTNSSGVSVPCYWKNGVRTDLPVTDNTQGGETWRMTVSGGKVYCAGYNIITRNIFFTNYTQPVPCYWKDSVLFQLPNPNNILGTQIPFGMAAGVAVYGTDVYICGGIADASQKTTACYWKNGGTPVLLPSLASSQLNGAMSIFINSPDVYISGYTPDSSGVDVPCYWKNGIMKLLSVLDESRPGTAYQILMSESNLYISGNTGSSSGKKVPCYWNISTSTRIDLPLLDSAKSGEGMSIAAAGSMIYVSGYSENTDGYSKPGYWLNGLWSPLYVKSVVCEGVGGSVQVVGDDVFSAGGYQVSNSSPTIPCIWMNGIRMDLSVLDLNRNSEARSIVVQ